MSIPFTKNEELTDNLGSSIPGQPLISLQNKDSVSDFLARELSTERLERISFMLFLVSKRRNISPLHHQAIKGRNIVVTERPDLHLVWYYDRIFVKPIPPCLSNYDFYKTCIIDPGPDAQIHKEANGFLRTYADMILYESDLELAKTKNLIPNISWDNWCRFIQGFRHLKDMEVSKRYRYGELRLTRLNFYSKVFLSGWNYFEMHHQYVDYFVRFIALYAFIFGAVSVILAAMQVALTADPHGTYKPAAHVFATFSIALTGAGLAFFPILYFLFQMKELFLFIFRYQKPK